jgi:hypothetical protein
MKYVTPHFICRCGHTGHQHEDSVDAPCLEPTCECLSFDEADDE